MLVTTELATTVWLTMHFGIHSGVLQSQQNCHATHQQNFTNDFAYSCICKFLVYIYIYIYKYVCVRVCVCVYVLESLRNIKGILFPRHLNMPIVMKILWNSLSLNGLCLKELTGEVTVLDPAV